MKKYIESEKLELKEKYTDIICKEIVSFLNGNGGTILIGIKDNGTVIGIEKTDDILKKFESKLIELLTEIYDITIPFREKE